MKRMAIYRRTVAQMVVALMCAVSCHTAAAQESVDKTISTESRPNILFCIADDWGWPHAGAYGDAVVQTPAFDRIAREGVLFKHAYVSSPSCTPSRGAILTGQWHWRLEGAANLWSIFPDKFATYPEILAESGFVVGHRKKAWGPGRVETKSRQLAGSTFKSFATFMNERDKNAPFAFWLGSSDPHRAYKKGSGKDSGMDLSKVHLFAHFPDHQDVRSDVADYYWEVQRFDRLVADAIKLLEETDQLENTIIVITGDHGMPFPRCKSNLYDRGTRVPLAVRWGEKIKGGRTVDDFVSLTDLAPTFLSAAGVAIPDDMTGRSLLPVLMANKSGQIDPQRDFVLFGKERHTACQEAPDAGGYPCRGIRSADFLYIRNFSPERWPSGTPHYEKAFRKRAWLADCDNGPTKSYIFANKNKDDIHRRAYDLCFAKRPAEELYDLRKDPEQLNNIAGQQEYAAEQKKLADQLTQHLRRTGDPRVIGGIEIFEEHPYFGGAPKYPKPKP